MKRAVLFLYPAVLGAFLLAAPPALARDLSREKSSYEANQKGVQFLERGRLKEAVEELEKAYRLNSKNKIIRENLAVAYNNYAVSLMNANRYLEAREFLEKASGLNPEDKSVRDNLTLARDKTGGASAAPRAEPDPWSLDETGALETIAQDFLLRGIRHFEKKEYKLAKEVLLESLRYSAENPSVYELLGDIAYLEQDLKKAAEYYTKSYKIQRSGGLEEKLAKLRKEMPVEEKLDPYADEHFILRYKDDKSGQFGGGFEIREYLRQAYRGISQDFGYYPPGKVAVLLYDEAEYRELSGTPAWTAGHYDGKIRLPVYEKRVDVKELNKLIWHELTHYFVQRLAGGRCPTWLNEGLAQVEENKVKRIDLAYFRAFAGKNALLPLEKLERGLRDDQEATDVLLFYQQSFVLTSRLVDRYRMFKIKKMLLGYGQGKTTAEVFKEHLGISPQAFEKKWLASLTQKKK